MHTNPTIASPREFEVSDSPCNENHPPSESICPARTGFRLVEPADLAERLANPNYTSDLVLLEAHFSSIDHPLNPERPPRHHIPGAIQIHPSYLEAGPNQEKYYPFYDCPREGNLLQKNQLFNSLEKLGLTPHSHVVVYGSEPDGTMAAARLVWGLLYAGVENVWLLDGGIDAWRGSGGIIDTKVRTVWEVVDSPAHRNRPSNRWSARPEYLATTGEIRSVASGSEFSRTKLVDVRRRGEWDGTLTDYYQFCSKAGHIPTAIHQGDWGNLLDPRSHKIGPRLDEVAARWRRLGIIDSDVTCDQTSLIFYCGTGWRSSIAFLVAHLLKLKAKNYDDGFFGWSWDETNEVAT